MARGWQMAGDGCRDVVRCPGAERSVDELLGGVLRARCRQDHLVDDLRAQHVETIGGQEQHIVASQANQAHLRGHSVLRTDRSRDPMPPRMFESLGRRDRSGFHELGSDVVVLGHLR